VLFEFDDDDDDVACARVDRLVELLDIVRANTEEINKIGAEIREDTRRRIEYVRLVQAYRAQRFGKTVALNFSGSSSNAGFRAARYFPLHRCAVVQCQA
jgi:hypothetical protein